jgi:hypothetical protein
MVKFRSSCKIWAFFVVGACLAVTAARAEPPEPYPKMAPLSEYLMNVEDEIALARSAAPYDISNHATIAVMKATGYEIVEKGTNNFFCAVTRSWGTPFAYGDHPNREFWNPKIRAPICYNTEATESIWPVIVRKTDLAIAGVSMEQMEIAINRDFALGKFIAPKPSAMAYMFSSGQYLGDNGGKFFPHVMIYIPYTKNAQWGGKFGSERPFVLIDEGSPHAAAIVPVATWIDPLPPGTASGQAPAGEGGEAHPH